MVDAVDTQNTSSTRATESAGAAQSTTTPNTTQEVSQAADQVGTRGVETQAQLTAGHDGFDGVAGDGKKEEVADASPAGNDQGAGDQQAQGAPPGLRDGQWFHDPRQLTPEQARGLEELSRRNDISPRARERIREFLDDYKNNRDRLFPDAPNPLPRPYPAQRREPIG